MKERPRFRIATYNTHKCRGMDGRIRPSRVAQVLRQGQIGAQTSTQEAETVAAAAAEQLKAIEDLAHGASQLSTLADNLSRAVRFVRGEHDPA